MNALTTNPRLHLHAFVPEHTTGQDDYLPFEFLAYAHLDNEEAVAMGLVAAFTSERDSLDAKFEFRRSAREQYTTVKSIVGHAYTDEMFHEDIERIAGNNVRVYRRRRPGQLQSTPLRSALQEWSRMLCALACWKRVCSHYQQSVVQYGDALTSMMPRMEFEHRASAILRAARDDVEPEAQRVIETVEAFTKEARIKDARRKEVQKQKSKEAALQLAEQERREAGEERQRRKQKRLRAERDSLELKVQVQEEELRRKDEHRLHDIDRRIRELKQDLSALQSRDIPPDQKHFHREKTLQAIAAQEQERAALFAENPRLKAT